MSDDDGAALTGRVVDASGGGGGALDVPSPTAEPPPLAGARAVRLVAWIIFLHITSFTLSVPGFQDLAKELFDGDTSQSGFFLGAVTAMIGCLAFFANPLYGRLSDSFGRRPFLVVGMCGYMVAMLLMGALASKAGFIIAGVVSGLTSAVSTMASAIVVDVSPSVDVFPRNFGVVGAAVGAGFILGAGLGTAVAEHSSNRLPFFVAAAADLVPLGIVLFVLPETVRSQDFIRLRSGRLVRKEEILTHSANPIKTLPILNSTPRLLRISLGYLCMQIAVGVVAIFLTYTEERFDWDGQEVGGFLFFFGVLAITAQVTILRWAVKRWSSDKVMQVGMRWLCLMLFLFGVAWEGWMMYVVVLVCPVALITPAVVNAEASKEVVETQQGVLQGAISSLGTIGTVVGSVSAAGLFSYFVSDHAFVELPGAPFFFATLLCAIGLGFIWKAAEFPQLKQEQFHRAVIEDDEEDDDDEEEEQAAGVEMAGHRDNHEQQQQQQQQQQHE